ncbi:DUF421 domain-containing protein [Paenibacillus chungangensis]|uniref:DUF421 domain-containing protein n=1 Tax=Paenibacillus chungangensis TaxID=696535 RepID=A0ABW3HP82_9BACL
MEWSWIWKSAFIVVAGMVLLRISGRKSISQMSVATTVIMISIGTTIVQPIANNQLWTAIGSAAVFIISLLVIEMLALQYDWFERLLSGRAKTIIENGQIISRNLRSIRMTVDQLEMRLRQKGIANIGDVRTATAEPNGQIGYELMPHAKPVTVRDLERMLGLKAGTATNQNMLFREVSEPHPTPIDTELE